MIPLTIETPAMLSDHNIHARNVARGSREHKDRYNPDIGKAWIPRPVVIARIPLTPIMNIANLGGARWVVMKRQKNGKFPGCYGCPSNVWATEHS